MLPVLVLLVAASALAAPGYINIKPVYDNDIGNRDNSLLGRVYDIIPGEEKSVSILSIGATLKDLAVTPNAQPQAYGQAIALLGELATGKPGDSCAAANLINEYVRYASGAGNAGRVRQALKGYVQYVASSIDSIARLVSNPQAARYATGSRGGCAGEGRTYEFEGAWDTILGSALPNQISLVNEEYCVAKRLYCAISTRSNNIAAQVTASALPPVIQLFREASGSFVNLVNRLASKENIDQAAGSAKQALYNAVGRVNL